MSEIQAAITDVDNTMLFEDEAGKSIITPRTVEAIAACEARGVSVYPVSSRSLDLMRTVVTRAGLCHSGVLDNGASVYDFNRGLYVSKRWLSPRLVRKVAAVLRPHVIRMACEEKYNPLPPSEINIQGLTKSSPSVFADYPVENEDYLLERLAGVEGVAYTDPMLTSVEGTHCVQVTLPGVNKRTGVQQLFQYENISGRLLVVGDNTNDIPLFRVVKEIDEDSVRVPVGNAPPNLLALANRPPVPSARDDGGLAEALNLYVLNV